MMPALTMRLDGDRQTREALAALSRGSGVSMRDVAYDQMRLWTAAAFKVSHPGSLSKGRKAMLRSLRSTTKAVGDPKWLAILQGWYDRQRLAGAFVARSASTDELQRQHLARLGAKRSEVASIGKARIKDKAYVSQRQFSALLRELSNRIGRLKSNWLGPNLHWAAVSHGAVAAGSAWVARRVFPREFSHNGRINPVTGGFIESTNATPYIGDRNTPASRMAAAKRIRMADLHRHALKRIDTLRAQFGRA